MNKAIITPAEADVYLAGYPDWLDLTNEEKTLYIGKASVYVQTQWGCLDVDWDNAATVPEVVREAVAYYAYAEFKGNLYGDPSSTAVTGVGQLTKKLVKAGSVTTEKQYSDGSSVSSGGAGHSSVLGYPDTLMSTVCTRNTPGSAGLTRV